MIIVSQDKETIVNFENIQDVKIEEYGTHVKGKKIYKIFSGNFEGYSTLLGTYETKERAKEVLKEFAKVYRFDKGERYTIGDEQDLIGKYSNGVYEMPED